MPLSRLTCPVCLAELRPRTPVPEGTRIRCPKCKGAFIAGGDAPPEEEPEPVQEPMPESADQPSYEVLEEVVEAREAPPPPRRRRNPGDDDEMDERPRRRRARKSGVPLWVWLTAGGVVLLLFCGCFGTVGVLLATGAFGGGSGLPQALGGSPVTWENYQRLHRGMSEAQVQAILGPPTRVIKPGELNPVGGEYGPNAKTLMWGDYLEFIAVVFENDKAVDRRCTLIQGGAGIGAQGFTDP